MPELKLFPKMHVASLTVIGPFEQAIPRGMDQIFAWCRANQVEPLGAPMAFYPDDPEIVPQQKLRTEICVPVAPTTQASGDVQVKEIGGYTVAVSGYRGAQEIEPAYGELYAWLHAQGYHDAGVPMETYLSQPAAELQAEIAIPVVKLTVPSAIIQPAMDKPQAEKSVQKPAKPTTKKPGKKPKKIKKIARPTPKNKPMKK